MLTKLQTLSEEREDGFTLIELLVVILVIGILSAFAIPAFLSQRKSAVDASVQSDVRNAATQIATWQTKNFNRAMEPISVTAQDAQASGAITGSPLAFISASSLLQGVAPASVASDALKETIKVSSGSKLFITQGDKSIITSYCIYGVNSGGDISASKGFIYDSENSGFVKEGMVSYCADNIPSDVTKSIAGGDNNAGGGGGEIDLGNNWVGEKTFTLKNDWGGTAEASSTARKTSDGTIEVTLKILDESRVWENSIIKVQASGVTKDDSYISMGMQTVEYDADYNYVMKGQEEVEYAQTTKMTLFTNGSNIDETVYKPEDFEDIRFIYSVRAPGNNGTFKGTAS